MGALDRGRDQGCDALEDPTAQPRRPSGRVLTAAPALTAIAAVLRNDSISVSREAIDAVRAFMTDGRLPGCTAATRSPPVAGPTRSGIGWQAAARYGSSAATRSPGAAPLPNERTEERSGGAERRRFVSSWGPAQDGKDARPAPVCC